MTRSTHITPADDLLSGLIREKSAASALTSPAASAQPASPEPRISPEIWQLAREIRQHCVWNSNASVETAARLIAGFIDARFKPAGSRVVNDEGHTVLWDYDQAKVTALRDREHPDMTVSPMWSHAPGPVNG